MTAVWRTTLVTVAIAVTVWALTMMIHGARAEEEAGPKWKIVVTLDGPPGKQELTYGNPTTGVHWFKDRDECEAARKGGDKNFAEGMHKLAKMQADMKKQRVPIEITTACKMDDSI